MHKFSGMRKITSLVLAVMIALSCVVVGVSAASTETVKVAFTNNCDWSDVYIYAWGTNDDALMGNWPGRKLTVSEDNGLGHRNYYTEVPKNAVGVIFSNGSSDQQTVNIAFSGQVTGWYIDGQDNGKYTVNTWDYKPEGDTQETTKYVAPEGYIRAVFTNNNDWSGVRAYAWDKDDEPVLGDWPGKAMSNLGDNGYGHDNYEIYVPSSAVGIVFTDNNGNEQTVDIDFEANKGWYLDGGKDAKNHWTVAKWDIPAETTTAQVTTTAVPTTTEVIPDGTAKIIFTNNEKWANVKVYAFDDKNKPLVGEWPGISMVKMGDNGYGSDNYFAYVPLTASKLVFSDGNENKTVDIPFETNKGWYITGQQDGLYTVNTWNLVEETTSEPQETTAPATSRVYFANKESWATVNAYAWDEKDNPLLGEWQGTAMVKVGSNSGYDIYAISVPNTAVGLVFSGGGKQTVDVDFEGSKAYFPKEFKNGKWTVGTFNFTEPTTAAPTSTITSDTVPYSTATDPVESTTAKVTSETTVPVETTTVSTEAEYVADLKCNSYSLSLASNIAMNFKVKEATLSGYTDPYLVVTMNGEETVLDNPTVDENGVTSFEFAKIYPQNVVDDVTAVLYAKKDGKLCYGQPYTKSVKEYCINNQKKNENPQELKGLLVNLLRYAAQVQTFSNYKIDDLATKYVNDSCRFYAKTTLAEMKDVKNFSAVKCPGTAKCEWKSATLSLGSTVEIKVGFTAEEMANKSVKVEFNGASYVFGPEYLERSEKNPDRVLFTYGGLYSNQMHDTVSFTVMEGDTPVSDTMTYSIASYANNYINNESVGPLLKAMMLYGQAAEAM